jgi:hypothetical protein
MGVDQKLLSVYLQDHMAGAVAGVELARRARGSNRGGPYGDELESICAAIEEHREELQGVAAALGIGPSRLKEGPAWIGEKLGRFKLNGRIAGYSPLSRMVEIEGLILGTTGQIRLWEALRSTVGDDPRLVKFDLLALSQRTQELRKRLEGLHERAAADAFT